MARSLLLVALLCGATGCVTRYPDSAYASTPVSQADTGSGQDTGGNVQDTGSGGPDTTVSGTDAATVPDTGGTNPLGSSAFVSCLQKNCPSQLAACESDSGCVGIVSCILKCTGGDTTCDQSCMGAGGIGAFTSLYECAGPVCQP